MAPQPEEPKRGEALIELYPLPHLRKETAAPKDGAAGSAERIERLDSGSPSRFLCSLGFPEISTAPQFSASVASMGFRAANRSTGRRHLLGSAVSRARSAGGPHG